MDLTTVKVRNRQDVVHKNHELNLLTWCLNNF